MITIDLNSPLPIYLQIVRRIKVGIAGGTYQGAEKLPPVRELALLLKINPNTVAKAYKILQEEGFLESRPGGGNYVAILSEERLDCCRKLVLAEQFDSLINLSISLGIDKLELSELLHQYCRKGEAE